MSEQDLGQLFREGLRAAAKPYERAAMEYRDTGAVRRAVRNTRRRPRLHVPRKWVAVGSAAAALGGVAAYALPNALAPSHQKVLVNEPSTTVENHGAIAPATNAPSSPHTTAPGVTMTPTVGNTVPRVIAPSDPQPSSSPGVNPTPGAGTTAPNVPAGPPDDTAAPVFTIANHVLATLDDHGLSLSATHIGVGLAEVGFWDKRTQPATGAAALTIGSTLVPAGSTAPLHLTMVDKPYDVGVAVGGGAMGVSKQLWADVPMLANNEGAGYRLRVDATLGHDGFAIQKRATRAGDEPYWSTDPQGAPSAGRLWITVQARPNERPTIHITPTDNLAHRLTIVGFGRFKNGDLSAGQGEDTFQLPYRAKYPDGQWAGKYVLRYSYPDGSYRDLVIWVLPY